MLDFGWESAIWEEKAPPLVLPASFEVETRTPLHEPALKTGNLLFLQTLDEERLHGVVKVNLSLHINGIRISFIDSPRAVRAFAWSPFTVVQALRLHSRSADEQLELRLFRISDFLHGISCLFGIKRHSLEEATWERAKWVATASCAIRLITLSLFPRFKVVTRPSQHSWTSTRLLAGHLLLFDRRGVTPCFCELHAPQEETHRPHGL